MVTDWQRSIALRAAELVLNCNYFQRYFLDNLRVTNVVDGSTPLQFVNSHKFWRLSKYIFPLNRLAWNLWGTPAPTQLASLDDLLVLYPNLVEQTEVGAEQNWGKVAFPILSKGQFQTFHATAEPAIRARVFSFRESTSVGRHSSLLAPNNTLVADLGYFFPHTDPKDRKWSSLRDWIKWRSRWLADLRFRNQLPSVQKLSGTAALLNNPWCHNYYHWMLEVAPRVMLLQQSGLAADWYVVDCQSSYQKRALELMGVPAERCIQPHYGLHLRADRFLRPTFPGLHHCKMMTETISRNIPPSLAEAKPKRIYISRKTAAHRKLVNEKELERCLKSYGFESFSFDQLSFPEQVRVMRSAECIVTVHGAALANLIFAPAGTRVIEICPVDRYNLDCFPRLSNKLGHKHLLVMAPSTRYRQNLVVDMRDMLKALDYQELRQTEGRSPQRSEAA